MNKATNRRKSEGRAQGQILPSAANLARHKVWAFRLGACLAAPVIFLVLLELILRLAGFGFPTAFLLPGERDGEKVLIQNNRFGWRFFGREMSRNPNPICLPQVKPPSTVRIFVFGESAAYGDPQSQFGLSRMLEAVLSLRHPGSRFEVVNTAMTAINSHVILPIARECAEAHGDIWVIYMGNNEVVGPFGAGTVFGSQTLPMPIIHASFALKATRVGELLDALRQWLRKPPPGKNEWGGMLMFLDQQVPADDPRMEKVYHNFERNLADIIRLGQGQNVGVVVSTVAVNLRDSAPFGSFHRSGLSSADKAAWDGFFRGGMEFQAKQEYHQATESFRQASLLDDSFAELHFQQAECALGLGVRDVARREFAAARDLDTLRFRCDSRLNDLIRQSVASVGNDRVLLADTERAFDEARPDDSKGSEFFYDHVHLTFAGNFLLAQSIAAQVEKLLPRSLANDKPWPAVEDCARRLAWSDWNLESALSDMLSRLNDPPFTGQSSHQAQLRQLKAQLEKSSAGGASNSIAQALIISEQALAKAPEDPWLNTQAAQLRALSGDLPGAESLQRRATDVLPSSTENWEQLGSIFARQKKFDGAIAAFRHACELDSQDVWAMQDLAQALALKGQTTDAIREYRRMVAFKPDFGTGWLGLGMLLEKTGDRAEAERCYRQAIAHRVHRAQDLEMLARFCEQRGWLETAATNYADAAELSPGNLTLWIETGTTFSKLGQHAEAEKYFAQAVRLVPDTIQTRFLYGVELGRDGKPAEAEAQFREAVRLAPDLIEARLNLVNALTSQGKLREALAECEEGLQHRPENEMARRTAASLRAKLGSSPQ
jgi:tetratricopeptide (TPR) repeat protein